MVGSSLSAQKRDGMPDCRKVTPTGRESFWSLGFFPCHCDDRSSRKVLLQPMIQGTPTPLEKSRSWELEVPASITSTFRRQQRMHAASLLPFSTHTVLNPNQGMLTPTVGGNQLN